MKQYIIFKYVEARGLRLWDPESVLIVFIEDCFKIIVKLKL